MSVKQTGCLSLSFWNITKLPSLGNNTIQQKKF